MAVMDVVAKQIYSVTLLTGNFCIMDVVSTLRLNQVLRCVAVCCSVLQCVAVCCGNFCILDVVSTLLPQPGVAVRCSVLQCVAAYCSDFCIMEVVSTLRLNHVLQCVAVYCSVLRQFLHHGCRVHSSPQPSLAECCRVLQGVARSCSVFECVICVRRLYISNVTA